MNQEALNVLRNCKIKPSAQRLAIMQYLIEHKTHPTVEDVYQGLFNELPTLSRTTVYNTLRMLSEHDAAQLLTIDERHVCYDGETKPHAHFICNKCNRVFDLFDDVPTDIANTRKTVQGFHIEEAQVYYKGYCPECSITLIDC